MRFGDPWIHEILIIISRRLNRDITNISSRRDCYYLMTIIKWEASGFHLQQNLRANQNVQRYIHSDMFVDPRIDEILNITPRKVYEH